MPGTSRDAMAELCRLYSYPLYAAAQLGMTAGALRVALHRLRGHYRESLRHEIKQTVASPADAEAEVRESFCAVRRR